MSIKNITWQGYSVKLSERGDVNAVVLTLDIDDVEETVILSRGDDGQYTVPEPYAWLRDHPAGKKEIQNAIRHGEYFAKDPKKRVTADEVYRQWMEKTKTDPELAWPTIKYYCNQHTKYQWELENFTENPERPTDEQIKAAATKYAERFYALNGDVFAKL